MIQINFQDGRQLVAEYSKTDLKNEALVYLEADRAGIPGVHGVTVGFQELTSVFALDPDGQLATGDNLILLWKLQAADPRYRV